MELGKVILYNRSRFRSFQFTLYHRVVCKPGACLCIKQPKRGADQQGETERVESSIFIGPRQQTEPLPKVILKIPQVQTALNEEGADLIEKTRLSQVQVYNPGPSFRRK